MAALPMAALPTVAALLERFQLGRALSSLSALQDREADGSTLRIRTEWAALDQAFPDGALTAGVTELASPENLGGGISVALAAVAAALRADPEARAAWIDADCTLYAPACAAAGIDLSRLLVVRPPRAELRATALKLALSLAFVVVVVDLHGAQSTAAKLAECTQSAEPAVLRKGMKDEVLVRRLALAAEEGNCAIVLLTDSQAPRRTPWPVALRLELARRPDAIALHVSKDRYGRIGTRKTLAFADHPALGERKTAAARVPHAAPDSALAGHDSAAKPWAEVLPFSRRSPESPQQAPLPPVHAAEVG